MKLNTYISPELIINADNQKAMIFFFYLKSKYDNSVFYGYTPEKLSQLTGLAINTVRKYVGYLVRKGYAKRLNGTLWLKSTYKISNERLIKVDTRPWTTFEQFMHRVYAAIIKWNITKQAFHYEMKSLPGNLKKKIDVRKHRNYIRTYGKYTKESELCKPINSIRQIARLFNRSQGWAQKMLSRLVKMKYATISQQIEGLTGYVPPKYYTGFGFAYFNKHRGITCIHHGTLIKLTY